MFVTTWQAILYAMEMMDRLRSEEKCKHVQDIVQASILVDPVTEADVGQSIVVTAMSAMPQLIQDGDTVQASTSVDPVTEADVGQSVVQTAVKTMSQEVPTAGSEVEPTEIPSIADQQAQATAVASDQEIIETQAAVQDSSVLEQGGDALMKDGVIVQASTSADLVTEADVGQSVVETVVSIMPQVVPTAGSTVEQTEIPAIADQQLIQAQATAAATTSVDPITEADEGQSVVETVVSIIPQVVPTAGSKVEQTEIPAIADQQLIQAQATSAAASSVEPVTEADEGQSVVETVVSIMPEVVPTAGSKVEPTEIPAIADQQLIQAIATAAATTSVDPVTEADEGQSVVETVVSIMPQVVPTAGSKVEQTEIPAIADQQLIQAIATAAAKTSVDLVTEADEGQSVVETVVSIMPEVVPTAGSKVEPTEIPDIADQPLMQAQATTEAADQEMIETQAAVQNSNGLDQSGDVSPEKEDLQVDTQVDTSDEYHSDHEGNAVAPDVQGIKSPPAEQESPRDTTSESLTSRLNPLAKEFVPASQRKTSVQECAPVNECRKKTGARARRRGRSSGPPQMLGVESPDWMSFALSRKCLVVPPNYPLGWNSRHS
ncbi:uncharacterized protein [Pocillopora verrucosa]|uniref:uncharacterized protein n=1 Tax=Pocillopora verrucosa TaxID=203993 RepID=UPI00333E263E